jgi:hypothetical protein
MLGSAFKSWGTCWEPSENLMGTRMGTTKIHKIQHHQITWALHFSKCSLAGRNSSNKDAFKYTSKNHGGFYKGKKKRSHVKCQPHVVGFQHRGFFLKPRFSLSPKNVNTRQNVNEGIHSSIHPSIHPKETPPKSWTHPTKMKLVCLVPNCGGVCI